MYPYPRYNVNIVNRDGGDGIMADAALVNLPELHALVDEVLELDLHHPYSAQQEISNFIEKIKRLDL